MTYGTYVCTVLLKSHSPTECACSLLQAVLYIVLQTPETSPAKLSQLHEDAVGKLTKHIRYYHTFLSSMAIQDVLAHIRLVTSVPDKLLPALYSTMDCVVSAHLEGGSVRHVVEAMAMALPVIGTPVGFCDPAHHDSTTASAEVTCTLTDELLDHHARVTIRDMSCT
jgi:hypothetical protein